MNNSKPKLLTAEDSAVALKVLAGFAPVSTALIECHIAALEAQRDTAKLVVDTNRATNQYHEDRRAHAERRSHALEAQNQQLREALEHTHAYIINGWYVLAEERVDAALRGETP